VKKIFTYIFLVVVFLVVIVLIAAKYLNLDRKTTISLIEPSRNNDLKKLPQGSTLDKPLNIPADFKMAIYADLKSASPRVLEFDMNGVLLASIPGEGKIVALPDRNADGIADGENVVINGLNRPHGMAFNNDFFYVAETDKVVRYKYDPIKFKVSEGKILFTLPGGGRHFTRTLKVLGDKLYTSVGSSCDTCVESDDKRAAILVSDLDGGNLKVFAQGLRNTVFFAFDPSASSGQVRIWGNDMGRDFLGDDLPPDELNIVSEGKDYGWPYCYGDRIRDAKFMNDKEPDYCQHTEKAQVFYPAHVAPLGIVFITSDLFPKDDWGKILVAFHGSWNRSSAVGYKIVKIDPDTGRLENFITGWLNAKGSVLGRPVDLIFANNGVLYISDDKANLIYILTK